MMTKQETTMGLNFLSVNNLLKEEELVLATGNGIFTTVTGVDVVNELIQTNSEEHNANLNDLYVLVSISEYLPPDEEDDFEEVRSEEESVSKRITNKIPDSFP
jgi:hypothetical protein